MVCNPKELKRPGGFEITSKAFLLCNFKSDSKILDIGCGSGATVNFLTDNFMFDAIGIDIDFNIISGSKKIIRASSQNIPLLDRSIDGIIMECSFSLMENQGSVLQECSRVLKNKGKLIITDMYARGEAAQFSGCLGKVDTKENIISLLNENLFEVEHYEDFTHQLQTMWGQMIFEKGIEAFYCELGVKSDIMKKVKCGYYLLIAEKKGKL